MSKFHLPYLITKSLPENYSIYEEGESEIKLAISYKNEKELLNSYLFQDFEVKRFENYLERVERIYLLVSFEKKDDELHLRDLDICINSDRKYAPLRSIHYFSSWFMLLWEEKIYYQISRDLNLEINQLSSKFNWEYYYNLVKDFPFEKNIAHFKHDRTTFTKVPFIDTFLFNSGDYKGTVLLTYYQGDDRHKGNISIHLNYEKGKINYVVYGVGISVIEYFDTLEEAYVCLKKTINKYRVRHLFESR